MYKRYIAKIYTGMVTAFQIRAVLSIQVYTGLFAYNPHFRQIREAFRRSHWHPQQANNIGEIITNEN